MTETNALPTVSHIRLLTYSSWLVVGLWLLSTGGQAIYQTAVGNHSVSNYLLGALRILIGCSALQIAPSFSRRADQPKGFLIRTLT